MPDLELIRPKSRAAWRAWLARHHGRDKGVWVAISKKHAETPSPSYNDAVEEALCFGWVDSTAKPLDGEQYAQWFAPRKPKSDWARSNKARVARLIADGLMHSVGLAKVAAAKRDGSWTALDAVEALEVPADLAKALRAAKGAKVNFDAFPPGVRKMILHWVVSAKRPETRAKRVTETATLAAKNIRAHV